MKSDQEIVDRLARIEQMLAMLLNQPVKASKVNPVKSPADIALEMARSGDVEGSKAYLKSLSSRRAA